MARRAGRDERGAAAVEFALVLVPLLVIVFGIIQYGVYFWAMQGGADAARSAARLAAVGNPTSCTAFRDAVKSSTGIFGASSYTITRKYSDASGAAVPDGAVQVGNNVSVSVQFNSMDFHLPFVPFIHNGVVESAAIARVDNVPDQSIGNCT